MAFDQRCYELAEHFLSGSPTLDYELNRRRLAQAIQDAIENTLPDLKPVDKVIDALPSTPKEAGRG